MARTYGEEYPERVLMSVLSDLLQIPHFSTSNGSTVRRDFLEAVAGALDVTVYRSYNKDDVLLACIAAAQRGNPNPSYLSPGSTVTDRALQAIIDGVTTHGVPNRRMRAALPVVVEYTDAELAEIEDPFPDAFDPSQVKDERVKALMEVTAREGQDRFRTAVIEAYGASCAVTGADAVMALEAAHIVPYMGPGTNRVSNGLALRADVHRLFDRGQLSVHEDTLTVLVQPYLSLTSYGELSGRRINVPRVHALRPAPVALRNHRLWAGL